MAGTAGRPNWKLRRRVILLTLFYCTDLLVYLMLYGIGDSVLHETLVSNVLLLVFITIGGYVFGSAADNHVNGHESIRELETTDTPLGTWKQRRATVLWFLGLSALGLGYLTAFAEDTQLNETFASGLCLLYGGLLNSWIFGVVWDDYTVRNTLLKRSGSGYGSFNSAYTPKSTNTDTFDRFQE